MTANDISADTKIADIISDADFAGFGRLIFPLRQNCSSYFTKDLRTYSGTMLGDLHLTWYTHQNPLKSVEIIRYFKENVRQGKKIFYDIYSEEEKHSDPTKRATGLFFFRGRSNARFALCNAGGGFVYVGAMHDSFPLALELSKRGYNAFALVYRPNARSAYEDLAQASDFVFSHAQELQVSTECYSLWGGSAGARLAATLASYGTEKYIGKKLPRVGAGMTRRLLRA